MNNLRRLSAIILTLAIPALGQAANPPPPAETLTVVMVDNRFQPDHLTFHAGQPYTLRLENHGKEMHEFTAQTFLKAATIADKSKMANGGTDVVIQPGSTVSIALVAPAKGHYDLICADHDWDGMIGGITVD
jgi:uncharacterized cupredoxin-like copper-binding protein